MSRVQGTAFRQRSSDMYGYMWVIRLEEIYDLNLKRKKHIFLNIVRNADLLDVCYYKLLRIQSFIRSCRLVQIIKSAPQSKKNSFRRNDSVRSQFVAKVYEGRKGVDSANGKQNELLQLHSNHWWSFRLQFLFSIFDIKINFGSSLRFSLIFNFILISFHLMLPWFFIQTLFFRRFVFRGS